MSKIAKMKSYEDYGSPFCVMDWERINFAAELIYIVFNFSILIFEKLCTATKIWKDFISSTR